MVTFIITKKTIVRIYLDKSSQRRYNTTKTFEEIYKMLKKRLYLTAAIAVTIFIFSNSLMPATESDEISRGLLSIILEIIPFDISHTFLRKLAHFTEFFSQGFFLALFFNESFKENKKTAVCTASTGFLTACIDETIQLFIEGRGPALRDVLIDFSGTLSSLIFLLVIACVLQSRSSLKC